ncbi:MAG: sugar phosphate isomerase/epimerase, partial [Puniceicoccales bacterium]|nr:sugar phosphate isomerase/epimerase [Puniceicoccales bacterium]
MNRRQAIKTITATGAFAVFARLSPTAHAQEKAAGTGKQPAQGQSFRHSVSAGYGRMNPGKLAGEAKKLGIEGIDLLHPKDWEAVRKQGLVCSLAWGPSTIAKGFNRREHHEKMVAAYIERIDECAKAGVPNVICFSGERKGLSDEEGLENCVHGLKQIAAAAEKAKVNVVMELLNSKVNHKDYQCDHTKWGVEVIKRVACERIKLLYDIYHMQIMEGDIIRTIRE